MRRIYLAGGFKSRWQERVAETLRNAGYEILDPSAHRILDVAAYTAWDLSAIRSADIILAYFEAGNPGGYALALEIGFGKALEKEILLVEEHPSNTRRHYFSMVRQVADQRFSSLEGAVEHLRRVSWRT